MSKNSSNNKLDPNIHGYLMENAPFDFDMFLFNTDFDDEKRFQFRKLFSRFQEIVGDNNFSTSKNYSEFRIKKILYAIRQLNYFAYSRPLLEREIFILLQYTAMLIQVASWEVSIQYKQKYEIYQKSKEDRNKYYHFHLELYEEIFIQLDFIQKNQKEIIMHLENYGNYAIIQKMKKLDCPLLFKSNYSKFENVQLSLLKKDIAYFQSPQLPFSENSNNYLNLLEELEFCVTLYSYISRNDYLFSFTKEYTHFNVLREPLLEMYEYDIDIFYNSPTYFRLFFLFFQDQENQNKDKKKIKIAFNSFRFKIQDFFNHLFFGNHETKYTDALNFKFNFETSNSINQTEKNSNEANIVNSIHNYIKTAHNYSLSPLEIYSEPSPPSVRYAFFPMAELTFRILSNELNSWCIKVSEFGEESFDLPDALLRYIRHWTAHEYILYQQSGINVNEATLFALEQNASTDAKSTNNQSNKSKSNGSETENSSHEVAKTYRVLYHYVSFLTGIVQNHIINLNYVKGAHSFFYLSNPQEIHPFLNFKQLYDLAKLLGPDGIKFVSDSVMTDLQMKMKDLFKLFILVARIAARSKLTKKLKDCKKVYEIACHQNEITEHFAAIGNLAFLRELLKFVLQTYIRDHNPRFYFDMQRIIAKKNALDRFDAEDKDIDYPASYEEFKPFIEQFDMEDDCNISQYLYSKFEEEKMKLTKNQNQDQNTNTNQTDNDSINNSQTSDDSDYSSDYDHGEVDELLFVARNCIFLVETILISDYYSDTTDDNDGVYDISDLAVSRGIDEFFSLLFYFKNEKNGDFKIDDINKVHNRFISKYDLTKKADPASKSSNSNSKDDKRAKSSLKKQKPMYFQSINAIDSKTRLFLTQKTKSIKFIETYFTESSFYHQDYYFSNDKKYIDAFKGRKRKRNVPKNTLFIENREWLDVIYKKE